MYRNATYRILFHMSSDHIHILQWQTTSFSRRLKHQATIYKLCNKMADYKSRYQKSRGPTKHKSNHCLSTGNENVLLALAWPFSKTHWCGWVKMKRKRYKNASVDENLLLRFHKVKTMRFQKRISVVQAFISSNRSAIIYCNRFRWL